MKLSSKAEMTVEIRAETRKVLWGQASIELFRAQELDREIECLDVLIMQARKQADACRIRASEFTKAAEELGVLDQKGL